MYTIIQENYGQRVFSFRVLHHWCIQHTKCESYHVLLNFSSGQAGKIYLRYRNVLLLCLIIVAGVSKISGQKNWCLPMLLENTGVNIPHFS